MWQPTTIMMDGELMPFADARLHPLSLAVTYATTVFEGLRAYHMPQQGKFALFRLDEHMRRLHDSGKIYRMDLPHGIDELCAASVELVHLNKLESCYIRPLVFRGYGGVGVYAKECPIETYLACWEWGKYLGEEGADLGERKAESGEAADAEEALQVLSVVEAVSPFRADGFGE